MWILGGWSTNVDDLCQVYRAIDRIDWKRDIVLAYNQSHQPHPDILEFFSERNRMKMPFPLVDHYVIDVADALNMEIRYKISKDYQKLCANLTLIAPDVSLTLL